MRILDWGDSCVSHPFHTLTVTLRARLAPRNRARLRPAAPARDAYLEPFGAPAPAADLAYRTGTLGRALAWHRYVSAASPDERDPEDAERSVRPSPLLEAGPIGTWE